MPNQQEKHTKLQQFTRDNVKGPISNTLTDANTGIWRSKRPVIDNEKCIKCGICIEHCPCGVIEKEVMSIDYHYCKGCGICVEECPKKAIDFINEKDFS